MMRKHRIRNTVGSVSPIALAMLVMPWSGCGTAGEQVSTEPASTQPPDAWNLALSLAGHWVDSTHGTLAIHEKWTVEGDVIAGLGYVMSGEDTVSIEDLEIVRDAPGLEYRARISTQNDGRWVAFGHQATGTDTLLFVNPGHDFPRSLRYVMRVDGELAVAVEGVEQDGQREEHFRFKRVGPSLP